MSDTPNRPPNILWICTDRQRHDTLGCYDNQHVRTPVLDKMAREGVKFEQAWCQNPICGPSRSSFMTGRYPRTARVNRNAQQIPPDEKLVSRLLADGGYVCGHAGKFHLASSAPGHGDWSEKRTDDGYSVFDWSMHPPDVPVSQYTAWLVEHGIEFKREPIEGSKHVTIGMDERTSNTAWIAQRAINYLTVSKNLNRPWFFTMNIEDPHNPFDPPARFMQPYLDRLDEIPLPAYTPGELDNKPPMQMTDRKGVWGGGRGHFAYEDMSDRDHRLIRASYWAMCDHIDYQVGRVLDALRETGQLDNTLVLFMSDHGEMLGDHGFYFQGPYFYEQMMHVPLLMRLPAGMPTGRNISGKVELVDIAPTLLDAAGLEPYPGMQGKSLWPILTGETDGADHRESVYHEYYRAIPNGHKQQNGAYITGVRNDKYALSAVHGFDCGELYDLEKDPAETNNLWDDPQYVSAKVQMLKLLCDRMAATIDPLPPTIASY